jgi:hypothetical protein
MCFREEWLRKLLIIDRLGMAPQFHWQNTEKFQAGVEIAGLLRGVLSWMVPSEEEGLRSAFVPSIYDCAPTERYFLQTPAVGGDLYWEQCWMKVVIPGSGKSKRETFGDGLSDVSSAISSWKFIALQGTKF